MNNRKLETVTIYSFTPGYDEYGRPRQKGSTSRTSSMLLAIYSQNPTLDIRYNNCELIGLSSDKTITDKDQIEFNGIRYDILHIIPSDRKYQVLMKKV